MCSYATNNEEADIEHVCIFSLVLGKCLLFVGEKPWSEFNLRSWIKSNTASPTSCYSLSLWSRSTQRCSPFTSKVLTRLCPPHRINNKQESPPPEEHQTFTRRFKLLSYVWPQEKSRLDDGVVVCVGGFLWAWVRSLLCSCSATSLSQTAELWSVSISSRVRGAEIWNVLGQNQAGLWAVYLVLK